MIGVNADAASVARTFELHLAFRKRKQGVVVAEADVYARIELRSALSHDDATRFDDFAAVALYAKAFAIRVAAVAR